MADIDVLHTIRELLEHLESTAEQGPDALSGQEEALASIHQDLLALAEQIARLSPAVRVRFPEVDWDFVTSLPPVLEAAGRSNSDPETLWGTLDSSLPRLQEQVILVFNQLDTFQ